MEKTPRGEMLNTLGATGLVSEVSYGGAADWCGVKTALPH
jgi:hypothetical protein